MALYNFENNNLEKVDPTTFSSEGILERQNLQVALKQNVDVVALDCLVIAEEFSEWSDSNRRIDLLAIDKNANLVVIELKRTERGEHMDLQAIRYAAMVSTLTFREATRIFQKYIEENGLEYSAEQKILDFLEWDAPQEDEFALDVRIVLVSANFSKELTTSVMWLLERDVNIVCTRLIPYNHKGKLYIDVQQIIPLPEAESYRVKIKEQAEERREARKSARDYSQYIFLDEQYNKRKLVLAVLRQWFNDNNPQSIKDFLHAFPNELHTGGLFVDVEKAQGIVDKQGTDRYFTNESETFVFPDGSRYAASNQWGKSNISKFVDKAQGLGYEIEVISLKGRGNSSEINEIVEEKIIKLKDNVEYRIVRGDRNEIHVFVDDLRISSAVGFLRQAIVEYGLDIPLEGLNTQTTGRRFFEMLRDKK